MGGRRLNTCQWCPLRTWEGNILPEPRFSHEKGWDEFYLMDFRLEGVALDILVEKSVGRDFTAGTKLNKNSSPPTHDSRMGLGLSGSRIQTPDIS